MDYSNEFEYLMRGKDSIRMSREARQIKGLSAEQVRVCELCHLTEIMYLYIRS